MARFWVIVCVALLMIILTIKSYCFTLEADYRGPGSEIETFEREVRDRENRESFERAAERDDCSQRDRERASEYERDHSA